MGRYFCCLYECICCPDPCYQPRWTPISDSAFWVESARPQTQQRLRYEWGNNVRVPDRSEFFWARERVQLVPGTGRGPFIRAPFLGERRVNYHDILLYTEVATTYASFFTELSYRALGPRVADHAVGFGDMNIGTKSLLYDCELLQLTFQFKTYLPTGNFLKGLGTGHISLEPSVILNVNCGPDSYLQTQIAEWIPIGGDPDYQGAVLHCHLSYNHVLWRPVANVPLIGTFESGTWYFQDGAYTSPGRGPYRRSSGDMYWSMGPGLRLFVCDRVDVGVGSMFPLNSSSHMGSPTLRTEARWRW